MYLCVCVVCFLKLINMFLSSRLRLCFLLLLAALTKSQTPPSIRCPFASDRSKSMTQPIAMCELESNLGALSLSSAKEFYCEFVGGGDVIDAIAAATVMLQMKNGMPLGTGVLIHPRLVLTTKHNLEGLVLSKMVAVVGYDTTECTPTETIPIEGVVEFDDQLDYAVLLLQRALSFGSPAMLSSQRQPPSTALLVHHGKGGQKKVSKGRILFYATDTNTPIVQALVFSDTLSSGGGYFDPRGDCFGIHVSVGKLGLSPSKEILLINQILTQIQSSILEKVMARAVSDSDFSRVHTKLEVTRVGEQSPLIFTRDEISIPIQFTTRINNRFDERLLKESGLKYFLRVLVYGIIKEHLYVWEEQTLASLGEDGLYRDDMARDKRLNVGGVRIDFIGLSEDRRHRVYVASVNNGPREDLPEAERNTMRRDLGNTVLAQVEVLNELPRYYCRVNMQQQLINRLRHALYRSFYQKRCARIA